MEVFTDVDARFNVTITRSPELACDEIAFMAYASFIV